MADANERTALESLMIQEVLPDVGMDDQMDSVNLGRGRRWAALLAGFSASMLVGVFLQKGNLARAIWQNDVHSFVDLVVVPDDWFDYGTGTVCRAYDSGVQMGNLGRETESGQGIATFQPIATEDACKAKCQESFASGKPCYAIEYQVSMKYCEIWKMPMKYTLNKTAANLKYGTKFQDDFQCSAYIPGSKGIAAGECKNETALENATDETNPCKVEATAVAAARPSTASTTPPLAERRLQSVVPRRLVQPPVQTPAEALAACKATEGLKCCLSTALNKAARAECCADPAHRLADNGVCLPCTTAGASCKLSGHCCDPVSQCFHTTGSEALCMQTCATPNSCKPWGKCATSESMKNCHSLPYDGNCCDPLMKCYFLDVNRTESKCMATCDDVRQNVGEPDKLCEEVPVVPSR